MGVEPLMRNDKKPVQPDKFRCMPKRPMKTRIKGLTKSRLRKHSFVHESKKQTRQFQDRLPQSTLVIYPPDISEPWVTDMTDIKVNTTLPSLSFWVDGAHQSGKTVHLRGGKL